MADHRPVESFGLPTQRSAMPTMQEAAHETRVAEQIQEQPAVQLAAYSQNFGQIPFPHDPHDTAAKAKGELLGVDAIRQQYLGGGQAIDRGQIHYQVPVTESDVAYYERKRAADEHLAFMQYAASKFDLRDPAQAEMYRRINPDYFNKQMEYVDSRLDTIKRWMTIRANGIQSMDDIRFMWMLDTGRISLPKGYSSFEELATDGEFDGTTIVDRGRQTGKLGYNNRGILSPMQWFATDTASYPVDGFGWSTTGDRGATPDRWQSATIGTYAGGPPGAAPGGFAAGRQGAVDFAARLR